MSQLTLIESIKKETKIDADGRATVSLRGAARIVNVSDVTLSRQFNGAILAPSKLAQKLVESSFEGANLEQFSDTGIPDIALAVIIEYYAFDAGRYCTEQALKLYRAFAAIGVRSWLQEQIGWQKEVSAQPQVESPLPKALPCPEITLRSRIVRAIDNHVFLFKTSHQQTWVAIYRELKYTHHYDVAAKLKAAGTKRSKLDQIEADGMMEQLRSVVEKVLNSEVA